MVKEEQYRFSRLGLSPGVLVILFSVLLCLLCFWPSVALCGDEENVLPGIHNFVVKGLRLLVWAGVGFCTVIGCIVFGDGFMMMWRDEPGNIRKGWKRIFWGFILNTCALVIVAIRLYVFQGADMGDTLAYKVWQTWMGG